MKHNCRTAALGVAGILCCTAAACQKKEPPVYEQIVNDFMQAVKDEDERHMLRALGEDVYMDSVEALYDEEPEFYRAMGFETAEDYATESFSLWFDNLTHHMKKFSYSIDLAEPVSTEELQRLLPPAQSACKPDEAYDISLLCETKDEDSKLLLQQIEDFYAVREADEWYIVLTSLPLIEQPWMRPAYNFLSAVQKNDLELMTQDESLELYMKSYEASVEEIIYEMIEWGVYDDWRQALYYLEVDTSQELALQWMEEAIREENSSYGDFTYTLEAAPLDVEDIEEEMEESTLRYLDTLPDVEEAYEITVKTGALVSGDIPERMVVGYVDKVWKLLYTDEF